MSSCSVCRNRRASAEAASTLRVCLERRRQVGRRAGRDRPTAAAAVTCSDSMLFAVSNPDPEDGNRAAGKYWEMRERCQTPAKRFWSEEGDAASQMGREDTVHRNRWNADPLISARECGSLTVTGLT